ncbi:hypothetical protein AAMO2058_000066200 [Amorphochlora amoebiformis]
MDPKWWAPFVAGAAGDMTATIFTHPMDVVKIHLQLTGELSKQSKSRPLSKILSSASRGGIYRGISASLLRQSVFATLRHGIYFHLNRTISSNDTTHNAISLKGFGLTLASAALAGVIGAVIANPADVVLIRMQSDPQWPAHAQRRYRHAFHGVYQVATQEGIGRLWRGCTPTVVRAVLVTASQVPSYHMAKSTLTSKGGLDSTSVSTHLLAASISAISASVATNPVDVVKTRIINMQKQGRGPHYSSNVDCIVRTIGTEGLSGLYKGLLATMSRLVPHTLILWVVQEQVLSAAASL